MTRCASASAGWEFINIFRTQMYSRRVVVEFSPAATSHHWHAGISPQISVSFDLTVDLKAVSDEP